MEKPLESLESFIFNGGVCKQMIGESGIQSKNFDISSSDIANIIEMLFIVRSQPLLLYVI